MTDRPNASERNECRLVMIDAQSMRILAIASATRPMLPRESIPAYARVAEALTEAIERRYGLSTVQLAILPGSEDLICCAVHEIIGSQDGTLSSLSFAALDEIASSELTERERTLVARIMKGEPSSLGRFARLGWIDELLSKIGLYRDRDSISVLRHLNQGIDFCLLNLKDADDRNLWFKAVGEPNTREYALTAELTRRFPAYLPRQVATMPEWNGWVMEDVEGVALNVSESIYHGEQALTALGVMQKDVANDIATLTAMGAKDWTCARIASLLEPFFSDAQCAMQAQTSTKARLFSGSELCQLKQDIKSALDEFMNCGIPETLVHGDIGHGNIIATSRGPVFLDWAETYIGHPFLSSEHLLADLTRSSSIFAGAQARLRSHYADHWKPYARPAELEDIAALGPAIAAFAYAVIAWEANRNRHDPTLAWPLLRSMLRRTKREFEKASEVIA